VYTKENTIIWWIIFIGCYCSLLLTSHENFHPQKLIDAYSVYEGHGQNIMKAWPTLSCWKVTIATVIQLMASSSQNLSHAIYPSFFAEGA
jgi:hypothetical protein